MWLHAPLALNILGVLASFAVLAWGHSVSETNTFSLFWWVAGMLYANAFEYGYHRVLLHMRVSCLSFLRFMLINHLHHHYLFSTKSTSRDPEDFENILTPWFIFALLLFLHYGVAIFIIPSVFIISFFGGVVLQFLWLYQIHHWFTHVTDSRYDAVLARIPVIGPLRQKQKEHHWEHHRMPKGKYSFSPILQWFGL